MTSNRIESASRTTGRRPRLLARLAVAVLAAMTGAGIAAAQVTLAPGGIGPGGPPVVGLPKLTINPTGPIGPIGPTGPIPGGPSPTGAPTTPTNGVGIGGTTPTPGITTTTINPTINPTVTPTVNPGTTTTTTTTNVGVNPNINVDPRTPGGSGKKGTPDSPYSMGSNPNCSSYRSWEGFGGRPCTTKGKRNVVQSGNGGSKQPPKGATKNVAQKGPVSSPIVVAAAESVTNELIIEVEGTVTEAQAIALAARHRLTRVESQSFPLIDATMFRWRIDDGRSFERVSQELLTGGGVKSVGRNLIFRIQQAAAAGNNPGQYATAKLLLTEAHAVSRGDEVRIAVIDSGIDVAHPELAGAIIGTYDALRSTDGPHTHGTGIAGAIAARSRLLGSAPKARLLAIRAFGATNSGAESTSFVVLKGLNYAVEQGAQIINMSFAGPKDPLLERGLAAAAKRGIILVAAAGNAGPKSPPLYPAADPNVIAVSATDATDRLFEQSNRGNHVALSAPGVDLLLPAPDEKYQVASGTSFAAAYVSGLAALIVERNPGVAPEVVRRILTDTARDLGPKGKDDQFGFGLANAWGAVQAARPVTAGATTRAIELPKVTR